MKGLGFLPAAVVAVGMTAAAVGTPVLVGHRGCGIGVENTAEAFAKGAERGYAILETDVRVSADTAFILCHDTETNRLGGCDTVASATLAQLRATPLHQQRFGNEYRGSICTLGEYLAICNQYDVRPIIELKWSTGINSNDCSLLGLLLDSIDAYGAGDKAILMTSMKPCLEKARQLRPALELQFLCRANWAENLDWADSLRIDMDIAHPWVDSATVAACHARGLKVNTWTVDRPSLADSLTAAGVDFITTNLYLP